MESTRGKLKPRDWWKTLYMTVVPAILGGIGTAVIGHGFNRNAFVGGAICGVGAGFPYWIKQLATNDVKVAEKIIVEQGGTVLGPDVKLPIK